MVSRSTKVPVREVLIDVARPPLAATLIRLDAGKPDARRTAVEPAAPAAGRRFTWPAASPGAGARGRAGGGAGERGGGAGEAAGGDRGERRAHAPGTDAPPLSFRAARERDPACGR